MGGAQRDTAQYFGLWSESVRNPVIKVEDDKEIFSSAELEELENSRVRRWTHAELAVKLFR